MPNIVKNTTLISLPDLIAPHSCRGCERTGSILCDCCKNNIISKHQNLCPICKTPNTNGQCQNYPNLPPIFIAGERADLIGDLVHDFKYHSIRALAKPLAEILHHTLPPIDNHTIVVPLPTISRHVRERGFDHTYLIAKHLAKLRGRNCQAQKLLIRTKNTVQVGTDRQARLDQAQSAYAINPKVTINPATTYILFDDVWTTGASMQAAIKKLRHAGAEKILVLILALSRID